MTVDQDLPWGPEPAPMVVVPRAARQHRHDYRPDWSEGRQGAPYCRCGAAKDEVRSRRGRLSRRHGNDFEREIAAKLGIRRVGQYGTATDVEGDWITIQAKVGGAFPERLWRWLPAAKGDQLRAVIVGDSPGPGRKRRCLIVLDLDDFSSWFGKP